MADAIVVKKPKMGANKSKGHKGKQQSHNKDTGKYTKQRFRTSQNKADNVAKAKARGDKAAGTSKPQSEYRKKKKEATNG